MPSVKMVEKARGPKHVVMLIDDHDVRVLPRLADAAQDALRIFCIRGIRRRAGQVVGCVVLTIAGKDAQLVHASVIGRGAAARRNQP
jgi:hypothetical protein